MGEGADCAGPGWLFEAFILRLAGTVGVVPRVASRFLAVSLRSRCERPLTSGFSGDDIAGAFSCIIKRCASPVGAGDCESAIVTAIVGRNLSTRSYKPMKKGMRCCMLRASTDRSADKIMPRPIIPSHQLSGTPNPPTYKSTQEPLD